MKCSVTERLRESDCSEIFEPTSALVHIGEFAPTPPFEERAGYANTARIAAGRAEGRQTGQIDGKSKQVVQSLNRRRMIRLLEHRDQRQDALPRRNQKRAVKAAQRDDIFSSRGQAFDSSVNRDSQMLGE